MSGVVDTLSHEQTIAMNESPEEEEVGCTSILINHALNSFINAHLLVFLVLVHEPTCSGNRFRVNGIKDAV